MPWIPASAGMTIVFKYYQKSRNWKLSGAVGLRRRGCGEIEPQRHRGTEGGSISVPLCLCVYSFHVRLYDRRPRIQARIGPDAVTNAKATTFRTTTRIRKSVVVKPVSRLGSEAAVTRR